MTLYTTQGFKNDMKEVASDGFTFLTTYKPILPTSKAEGLYFLSGSMQGTKRNDQNLIEKDLIILDYDALSENFTPETFYNALIEKIGNYSFMAYPTISHTTETPKYRVIIPLQSPIANKETYREAVTYLTNHIGLEHDSSAKKWSQLQGMPVHENMNMIHITPLKFEYDSKILMVDRWAQRNRSRLDDYAFYLNAHMVLTRAVVAQELTQDQAEACLTLLSTNEPEQIENNIQKIRTEIKSAQRLDDPLSYFRLNASIIEFFEGLPLSVAGEDNNLWLSQLDRHKEGYLLKTTTNLKTILGNDPALKDLFIYNEFSEAIEKADTPPWERTFSKQWTDTDLAELDMYFGDTWKLEFTGTKLQNAVLSNARTHRYHPIKSMIELNPWDGVPRAETIFTDYLGAADDIYMRTVARKWLSGAVARIYNPVKFEILPVLLGKQGRGKSTLAKKLGGEHFNDDLKDMKSKDAKEFLFGSWIIELGELSAMKRTEVDEVKGFISITSDRYRPSYGRVTIDKPRTCVFIGTTNDNQFLKDVTGNRRFFPIPIDRQEPTKDVFTLDKDTVQQIWAEAYTFYQAGEELFVPKEIEELAEDYRSEATSEDPIETSITEYLDILLPEDWEQYNLERKRLYIQEELNNEPHMHKGVSARTRVTAKEISTELFCTDPKEEARGRAQIKSINMIMSYHPEWTAKVYQGAQGKSVRGYTRN